MEGYLSSHFFSSTPIFPSCLPPLCSDLSVLYSSHFLSFFFVPLIFTPLLFSLQLYSMLSALSSELSHFLPFQPFWFLSSKYSISHPYCEFSLCASSLSSKYCAIKWFENSLTLTDDLMKSLKTGLYCDHRSVFDVKHKSLAFSTLPYRHRHDVAKRDMKGFKWREESTQLRHPTSAIANPLNSLA